MQHNETFFNSRFSHHPKKENMEKQEKMENKELIELILKDFQKPKNYAVFERLKLKN